MRSSVCLIGITGLPGSGKSLFATHLARLGVTVISADSVGHEVLTDPCVVRALAAEFGIGIAEGGGTIDRSELGRRLVSRDQVDVLNRIVHPPLLRRLAKRTRDALTAVRGGAVAVDAALIPEWGIEGYFDLVVFVAAPAELRHARMARVARDQALIQVLEQSQLDEDAKRERSHIVVENLSTIERLQQRADALFIALTRSNRREESCPRRLWSD